MLYCMPNMDDSWCDGGVNGDWGVPSALADRLESVVVLTLTDKLKESFEEEVREEGAFSKLPFHYQEIAAVILSVYVGYGLCWLLV